MKPWADTFKRCWQTMGKKQGRARVGQEEGNLAEDGLPRARGRAGGPARQSRCVCQDAGGGATAGGRPGPRKGGTSGLTPPLFPPPPPPSPLFHLPPPRHPHGWRKRSERRCYTLGLLAAAARPRPGSASAYAHCKPMDFETSVAQGLRSPLHLPRMHRMHPGLSHPSPPPPSPMMGRRRIAWFRCGQRRE